MDEWIFKVFKTVVAICVVGGLVKGFQIGGVGGAILGLIVGVFGGMLVALIVSTILDIVTDRNFRIGFAVVLVVLVLILLIGGLWGAGR